MRAAGTLSVSAVDPCVPQHLPRRILADLRDDVTGSSMTASSNSR